MGAEPARVTSVTRDRVYSCASKHLTRLLEQI